MGTNLMKVLFWISVIMMGLIGLYYTIVSVAFGFAIYWLVNAI
jgi:hypothetical protein